jgi:hypothetical protein
MACSMVNFYTFQRLKKVSLVHMYLYISVTFLIQHVHRCKYSDEPSSHDAFIPPIWTPPFIPPKCVLTNKYAGCMFLGLSFIDFPRPRSLSQSILYRIKFVHHGFTERFTFEERVHLRGQGCCGTLNVCLGAFFSRGFTLIFCRAIQCCVTSAGGKSVVVVVNPSKPYCLSQCFVRESFKCFWNVCTYT